jgi:hypothetical protein
MNRSLKHVLVLAAAGLARPAFAGKITRNTNVPNVVDAPK